MPVLANRCLNNRLILWTQFVQPEGERIARGSVGLCRLVKLLL